MELLKEQRSIRDVSNNIGCSYHTARNDLMDLVAQGLARQTGSMNERGEGLFIAGGKRPMVELLVNNQAERVDALVKNWCANPAMPNTYRANHTVMQIATELMWQAKHTDALADQVTLNNWKKALVHARPLIQRMLDICDGLIKNERLWIPEQLQLVGTDPEFNAQEIEQAYVAYLTFVEERDRSTRNG